MLSKTSPSHRTPAYTDVLVIGAGPCGLMAAQALARLGIHVMVVERRQVGTQYGNADGLQPRTLEIWESYGILQPFRTRAAPMHAIVAYESKADGSGLIRGIPSNNVIVEARYPYELTASIETIEGTLLKSYESANGRMNQPALPIAVEFIEESDDLEASIDHPIKVTVEHLSGKTASQSPLEDTSTAKDAEVEFQDVYCKFVIGADGAHSWVRRYFDIAMDGDLTEYVWGVADVNMDTDFPDQRFKCVIQSAVGAIIFIPREDEKVRIYVQLCPEDGVKTADGRFDKSAWSADSTKDKILTKIKEGLRPYRLEFNQIHWCTIFSVPQMVASKYCIDRRIFIAGDACHVHSPKAGQGANASMGDAHNLAWKIAYVLRGWASEFLLDTYEVERRKYAQDLIAFDQRIAATLEDGAAADYSQMLHEQNLFTSGIGIRYESRLTDVEEQSLLLNVKAGSRLGPADLVRLGDWECVDMQDLAISDGRFKLFIFSGDILLLEQNNRISDFAQSLADAMSLELSQGLAIYTILDNRKETVHWKLVPQILQSWKCVFVDEESTSSRMRGPYSRYGISAQGAVELVRPDGYISMITSLSGAGAQRVLTFLRSL